MQLSKLFLSALVAMSAFGGLYAKPQKDSKPIKLYVDPSEVQVSQDGIALKTENGTLNIKTLRSDENGLYMFEKDFSMVAKPSRPQAYKCPICRPSKYFCSIWARQEHIRRGKHSTLR
jgi:hypothetical protein